MRLPLGTPFEHLTFTIPRDTLTAVVGPHGSGKTSLLLTLGGRMVLARGTLEVAGCRLPREHRRVAKICGMGVFAGLNDLADNLLSRRVLTAELELYRKPHHRQDVQEFLENWGLSHIADIRVRDLDEMDRVRFGIALALVNQPKMLIVDDVEDSLTLDQSLELMHELYDIAHVDHVTTLVSVTDPTIASAADQVIPMERAA
jgi:ABC-type cobalamin/Fe3+-siderophores transport system ATPase subunit